MEQKHKRKIFKCIKWILLLWVVYVVICLIVPPLFHRTTTEQENRRETQWLTQDIAQNAIEDTAQERVLCIEDNEDALIWRLRLIEEAQDKLVLSTFDFRDDNSGRDMMAALYHAADRGVEIQIIVDGINGTMFLNGSRNFRQLAAHENVQVKLYNPINLLTPWKINYRMHDKYLIADDFAYILGGRNTDDLFLGQYVDSYNEDRDILVYETVLGEGRSYRQLRDYFEQIWNLPCAKPYEKKNRSGTDLEAHYQTLREKYPQAFTDAYTEMMWEEATLPTGGIELYTNPIEPENKQPLLWDRLVHEMTQENEILIQTPYIICSRKMYHDLADIAAVAETEVITNAVEGGANPFGCTDYLNQKKKIQETGVHTYECLAGQALHTKTILIGDRISIVGSCNLDMRSVYLDTEMMLMIDSEELNEEIRSRTDELKAKSRHVFADGTVENGTDFKPVKQGIGKKILYTVLRVVILPIRHLL